MNEWSLNLFTTAVDDYERAQYQILNNLQTTRAQFASNRIYPYLGDLINLFSTLQTIVQNTENLKEALPGKIKDVDMKAKKVIYEKRELDEDQMRAIEDLIRWSLPHIRDAIDEGRTIYEFVDENLHMEEVGIVPSYVQEGYLFVPDHEHHELHILEYSLSIFTGASERYRSLKTAHIRSVPQQNVRQSPHSLKISLMEERRTLPNPATYCFDFDLDFPYESTVLPVAKRKLMRYLFSQQGKA